MVSEPSWTIMPTSQSRSPSPSVRLAGVPHAAAVMLLPASDIKLSRSLCLRLLPSSHQGQDIALPSLRAPHTTPALRRSSHAYFFNSLTMRCGQSSHAPRLSHTPALSLSFSLVTSLSEAFCILAFLHPLTVPKPLSST